MTLKSKKTLERFLQEVDKGKHSHGKNGYPSIVAEALDSVFQREFDAKGKRVNPISDSAICDMINTLYEENDKDPRCTVASIAVHRSRWKREHFTK